MKKKNIRNRIKRYGILVLCLVVTMTLCSGIGPGFAAFAETMPETDTVIESEGGINDNEVITTDETGGDDTAVNDEDSDVYGSDEFEPVPEAGTKGEETVVPSALESDTEGEENDVFAVPEPEEDVFGDDDAILEWVSDLDMGTLIVGYTQAEANEKQKEIKVKNSGSTALTIDPETIFSPSAFKMTRPSGFITIEPGEEAVVGWIKPAHQLKAGVYNDSFQVRDVDYTAFTYCEPSLTVLSRTVEFTVTQAGRSVSYLTVPPAYPGYPPEAAETYELNNNSSGKVRFNISCDNSLFKVEFAGEGVTSETLFDGGESAEVKLSLNKRKAVSLKAGTYEGNILFTAVSEDGSVSKEIQLPVDFMVQDYPAWEMEEDKDEWPDFYANYNIQAILDILNTAGLADGNVDDYILVDLVEGEEYFDLELKGYSSLYCTLKPKEKLPAGTYPAKLDLYFDPAGNVDLDEDYYIGTCKYTLIFTPSEDGAYEMGIKINEAESGYVNLGILYTGYTAEEAAALRASIEVKNTGTETLNVSSGGLYIDEYDDGTFVDNRAEHTESEQLATGDVYDKLWIQPEVGLAAGEYSADVCMYDDGYHTETNDITVYFIVVEKGFNYKLELSGLFSPDVPITESGIDFGTAADSTTVKAKYVYATNTGDIPLDLSVGIVDDEAGIFSAAITQSTSDMEVGGYRSIRVECDQAAIAAKPGVYTAKLKLTMVNKEDNTESVTELVPLMITAGEVDTRELTLDFQGKGGDDYPNTTIKVVKGSKVTDGVTKIMRQITGVKYSTIPWPTDDEYTMICISGKTDAELAELGTWEAAEAAQNEFIDATVEENTTVYVNWAKKISSAKLSVSVPSCGEAIPENAEVKVDEEDVHYFLQEATWDVGSDETAFTAGNRYNLKVVLTADFGYALAADCDCTINGKAAVNQTKSNSTKYFVFRSSVTAKEHTLGECYPTGDETHAARCTKCHQIIKEKHNFDTGEDILEPACTTPGKILYTCADCGYEKTVIVPALGHDFVKETLEEKASDQTEGTIYHQCANCKQIFEEGFWYAPTDGNNSDWYRDSNKMLYMTFVRESICWDDRDLVFDFDMHQPLIQILLDGKELESGSYSLTTTNDVETEVGLFANDLNSLSDGEHTLTFVYEDGMRTGFFNVKTGKYINEINIEIRPPVCGESAKYGIDQYGRLKGVNTPVITLPENCGYSIGEYYFKTRWSDENNNTMWEGTFTGGETAYAYFYLVPDEGYVFANETTENGYYQAFAGKVIVNGIEVTPVRNTMSSFLMRMNVPVEAIHNISDASYKWTSSNGSVTATGTCTAEGCGATVTEKVNTTSEVTKKATYTATGIQRYTATFTTPGFEKQTKKVTIAKRAKLANTVTVKGSTKTVKYANLQKKNQTIKGAITVKKAKGKVTYKKLSGDPKILINSKTGVITVKKGLKKGKTYTIRVRVTAAGTTSGDPQYKKASKTVRVKIKVS